ncbi:MAG: hypothetical protein K1Y36_18775 [Blastocatellia bacterium]|nr:hypothetical protein [Blastocatellia bacterium]
MSGYGYAQPVATEDEPNLLKGIAAGTVAAIIGSVIWIVISGVTHYQIGWMAVGVGFLVGISIQKFGKGSDPVFGFAGAGLSLAACVAGNMILGLSFSPMDILFYGLAIYEGYRFSIKQ